MAAKNADAIIAICELEAGFDDVRPFIKILLGFRDYCDHVI